MPIENEFKFILKMDAEFEALVASHSQACFHIEQGYVSCKDGFSIRLRKKSKIKKNKDIKSVSYLYTVKKQVNGNIIELENRLSVDDFDLLWPSTTCKLKKYRYLVQDKYENNWEIDFFKSKGETYIILAEIELPPHIDKPEYVPRIVSDNCIHVVTKGDKRFSAKRLGDPDYATSMLKLIKKQLV